MPSWAKIRATFPTQAGPAREARILELVKSGAMIPPDFMEFTVSDGAGRELRFSAAKDAIKLGTPDDAMRVNVSHETTQKIADWMGWIVPTAAMVDVVTMQSRQPGGQFIGANAVKTAALEGKTQAQTSSYYMERHSRAIDARQQVLFIAGPWKQWISGRRLSHPTTPPPTGTGGPQGLGKRAGLQYGYYDDKAPSSAVLAPLKLWQRPGATHSITYTDASEYMRPFGRLAELTEGGSTRVVDLEEIAKDPELAHLVSHEGPVLLRHPWLPICKPLSEGGGCSSPPGALPSPGPAPAPGGGGAPPAPATKGYEAARLLPLAILGAGAVAWYLFRT